MHPKLILLPGLDGTGDLFDPLLAELDTDVRPVVVRYRSPPLTRYEDCQAAVTSQLPANEPYVLLGESFSGPIAVSIAATRPPGLRGVILSASFVSSPTPTLKRLQPLVRFLPMGGKPGWVSNYLLLSPSASPALRDHFARTMASVAPPDLRARLREIALVDVSHKLAAIDAPILYLRATRDRLVPAECADRIARATSRVRIVDFEAPHMLLQTAPGECARVIGEFVRYRT
jgi:pimeloyl-ACP methyl ester carboxylesterase